MTYLRRRTWLSVVLGQWSRPVFLAVVIGAIAGLAAALMEWGLHAGTNSLIGPFAEGVTDELWRFNAWVLILPSLGGLFSGLAVVWFCPDSKGHGTDALSRAFHRGYGEMPLKAPAVKAAAAVAVISTGGSAGPEGPIAALGAALGSTIGHLFHVTPRERRILLIAGCAAGVGAIFRCPLGGALFAVSVMYSEPEYESEAIVPSVVASVIGYTIFMALWGQGEPLLQEANKLTFSSALELVPYAVLGLLCGLATILFGVIFELVEEHVGNARRLPRWLAPALGGLATGAVACLVPMILDPRYRFIQAAMDGTLFAEAGPVPWSWWVAVFGALVIAKCLATSFTVGSGGSGGLLGPSVFLGGAVGAFLGALLETLYPLTFPEPLRQALIPVGMGGVLAASMRIPVAAIVMITEMTASYHLIVPLMLVCTTSYVVGRRWGLNKEQVPTTAESPVHAADAIIHMLESWRVGKFLETNWKYVVSPGTHFGEIIAEIEPGTQPTFVVVDDGQLQGLIALPDLDRLRDPLLDRAVVASDIMSEPPGTLGPDDDLYEALELFRRGNQYLLPVVADEPPHQWLGILTRSRIYEALSDQIEASRQFILKEYSGLIAIDQEAEMDNLLRAVAPSKAARIERLMVPLAALGKSIRECDFRRQFGVQIVAIELPDGTVQAPPDVDSPLQANYRLLVIAGQNERA